MPGDAQVTSECEKCWYYDYDETYDMELCQMDLDEDEVYRISVERKGNCPFFRPYDEYALARRQ